jgi:hypothetical protein
MRKRRFSARQSEHMLKNTATIVLTSFAFALALLPAAQAAFAQGCDLSGSPVSTLRNPLIYGASSAAPFEQAPEGQPPPIVDGSVPAPVTPGMTGPPTLPPTQNWAPAQIDRPDYYLPYHPATEAPPGVLGPSMWAPPPPSTPGADPGIIHAPLDFYRPPARVVSINPGGGIPGPIPTQRWGGQTTRDFGRYKYAGKRAYDFGQGMPGQTSQDGPWQTLPGASSTCDLYGRRMNTNDGFRNIQTIAPY